MPKYQYSGSLPPIRPFWWAHYSPPYSFSDPGAEVTAPGVPGGPFTKVELASPDGNLSIGGAVGGGGAVWYQVQIDPGGPDRWMFGDASIAMASLTQVASFPAWDTMATMSVSADIVVGDGTPTEPEGVYLVGGPGGFGFGWTGVNGWIGVLGNVILSTLIPAVPFVGTVGPPGEFISNWANGLVAGGLTSNYFQPKFSVSAAFHVPPKVSNLPITVTAWAAALRDTSVAGYETDGASFQFLDPMSVTGGINGLGGPGPIRVTGIDVYII